MDYTSIKVGQLPTGEISGGNFIPHEVAGILKKATITDLAAFIGANDAVGFRAVSVQNGGTLPATDTQEFILVGPGTYNNVGGGSTITVTEELNALVSNGTFWFVGVEIPIDAPPGNAIWGQIIGTLSNQTDLKNILDLKADLVDGKVPASQLPSYVDDIIEVANYAALPATGETGKIYLTLDNNKIYRWSGSVYIEIAAENAVWGQIVGTLSNQTDLQNALNAKVPYTGATANVDLGTHTLSSKNLVVNHASGSGVAAQITKGGNGEALTVSKSSGTGNAASILGGVTLLSELHLNTDLADAYIASAATWNAKQNALNGTGFVKISGTTISYDNNTYALDSDVVKLTGDQTIAGVKTFSSLTDFSSSGIRVGGQGWLTPNQVYGEGTSNFFVNFSGGGHTIIGNSGKNVGIGTTSPLARLHVVSVNGAAGNTLPTNATAIFSQAGNNLISISGGSTDEAGVFMPRATSAYYSGVARLDTNLIFRNNDAERMRITSNGELLIGRTSGYSAGWLLAVEGNVYAKNDLRIDGGATFGGNLGLGVTPSSWGTSNKVFETTFGTSIIGRTDFSAFGRNFFYNSSDAAIYTNNGNATAYFQTAGQHIWANSASGTAGNAISFTQAMTLDASGRLGIGTTSPNRKLEISTTSNGIPLRLQTDGSNTGIEYIGGSSNFNFFVGKQYNVSNAFEITPSTVAGGTTFTTPALVVNSSGNVGIGTTSPTNLLSIKTASSVIVGIDFNYNTDNSVAGKIGYNQTNDTLSIINNSSFASGGINFSTSGSERMRITSGGNVFIGTTSELQFGPSKLNIAGDFYNGNGISLKTTNGGSGSQFIGFINESGTVIGSINRVSSTNAVAYYTSSDYRLKEDLKQIKGLELISKIKVYDFKWKNHTDRMDGVLAHELQEVVPYAVNGEKDAEQMQSVDYSKLVPILVQAIQELKAEIEILKNK
jgi:hypothetical protein